MAADFIITSSVQDASNDDLKKHSRLAWWRTDLDKQIRRDLEEAYTQEFTAG